MKNTSAVRLISLIPRLLCCTCGTICLLLAARGGAEEATNSSSAMDESSSSILTRHMLAMSPTDPRNATPDLLTKQTTDPGIHITPADMQNWMSGRDSFCLSVNLHSTVASQSHLADTDGDQKTTADFFGKQVEIERGHPEFSSDPMTEFDQNKKELNEERNNRVVINQYVSVSQASGFVFKPFPKKDFEINIASLKGFSLRFGF